MAYQLSDIVTKVQQRVRDTGYSTTEIKNYINDTQNDVFNEYRLPFMQATQNYTLASNTADMTNGVGLPSNFVQAFSITLTSTGKESNLLYMPTEQVDVMNPDPTDTTAYPASIPTKWYEYAETINLFPVPNEAYTVTMRYWKKPTLLSADADVPELPSEFEELLVVGASYRVMQVKDNYDQASILQNKYDEILQKLVVKYSVKQTGQPVRMRLNRYGLGKAHF